MTTGPAAVIDRVTLVVSDLDRAEDDYVRTFGCHVEHRGDIDPALVRVLCIRRARGRRSLLRLGRERIELLEFTETAGRPYPLGSTSTDLWFQHVAIVVTDMRRAYLRVMANRRFRPISRQGPVRLPGESGGVTAFKFRDQDGHPLELLAFPAGDVPEPWRTGHGNGSFVGVDHTAIAVSDSARSARFFGSVFGFSTAGRTENRGPEQADLDDVDDVHVSVTRLAPDLPAPRMELLDYHVGPRLPIPPDTASSDIVATHSVVRVASLDATAAALARCGTSLARDDLMILAGGIRAALVSGPDGHRFLAEERAPLPPREKTSRPAAGRLLLGARLGRVPEPHGQPAVAVHPLARGRRLADDQALDRHRMRRQLDRIHMQAQPAEHLHACAVEQSADIRHHHPGRRIRIRLQRFLIRPGPPLTQADVRPQRPPPGRGQALPGPRETDRLVI